MNSGDPRFDYNANASGNTMTVTGGTVNFIIAGGYHTGGGNPDGSGRQAAVNVGSAGGNVGFLVFWRERRGCGHTAP